MCPQTLYSASWLANFNPGSPQPIRIAKRCTFSCAHHYWVPAFSDEENRRQFGPCSNRHGHGHNYQLYLGIDGPIELETGMVINLNELRAVLKTHVLDVLDHKNLNHQVPFFKEVVPTTEAIVLFIWHRLEPEIKALGLTLAQLHLQENETLQVVYNGAPGPEVINPQWPWHLVSEESD